MGALVDGAQTSSGNDLLFIFFPFEFIFWQLYVDGGNLCFNS